MHAFLFLHNKYIPDHVTYTVLVMAILALLGFLATRRMDIYPNKVQNVMEVFVNAFHNLLIDTMGEHGKRFFPLSQPSGSSSSSRTSSASSPASSRPRQASTRRWPWPSSSSS